MLETSLEIIFGVTIVTVIGLIFCIITIISEKTAMICGGIFFLFLLSGPYITTLQPWVYSEPLISEQIVSFPSGEPIPVQIKYAYKDKIDTSCYYFTTAGSDGKLTERIVQSDMVIDTDSGNRTAEQYTRSRKWLLFEQEETVWLLDL